MAYVLIYDRLIVSLPAEREGELRRKWERRWDPARQAELLGVIEAEMPGLVRTVPWTTQHDRQWRRHAERDGLRLGPANATSRDVDIIQAVDRAGDPDSLGQLAERDYLVNLVDRKQDKG